MYDINALVGYGSLWTFEMIFGHEKKIESNENMMLLPFIFDKALLGSS